MKKLFFFTALVCSLLAVQTANAQNPITTLEHSGTTSVFYGQNSLVDAYNASVNGDYLYLSPGYFTAPASIAKGVKIIGAGHFPDSASVAKRTYILSGLTINAGADSLRLEGLYINGDINYAAASSINYVKVIRCNLGNVRFNSSSAAASKNYCSYEECFIFGSIIFSYYGNSFNLSNSIISGHIQQINSGALIERNIFTGLDYIYVGTYSFLLREINSTVIQNNIILCQANNIQFFDYDNCSGNMVNNNLYMRSGQDSGNNSCNNNYYGVAQASIFVNQTGNSINYTHDYHLKSPTTYLGTDGTQIGLYGGKTPFKDKGLPSNPQVISKSIGTQTDANGNLKINFSVKAQDR